MATPTFETCKICAATFETCKICPAACKRGQKACDEPLTAMK